MSWAIKAEDKWNKFKETITYKKIVKAINSNFVAKTIALIIIWAVALVPVWIYLTIRAFIDPIGFWQELALFFVCAVCMGWIQGILGFFGVILSGSVIFDEL
jgi:hypothetical protein